MLVELVALFRRNFHLLLPVATQHLLCALFVRRLLLLCLLAFVLVQLVRIVCCLSFFEIMFHLSLVDLMPLLYSLLLFFVLLPSLCPAVLYLPLPRAVLPLLWCGKVIFIIYCIGVWLDWCFCIHFMNSVSVSVSMRLLSH